MGSTGGVPVQIPGQCGWRDVGGWAAWLVLFVFVVGAPQLAGSSTGFAYDIEVSPPAHYTYDAAAVGRSVAREIIAAEVDSTRLSGVLEGSSPPSVEVRGTSTTPALFFVAPTSAAGSIDDSFVYRGVARDHPGYSDALEGVANPRNPNALTTAADHNAGNTVSPYTSWTHDPSIAARYAGPDGAVIRVPTGTPPPGTKFDWSPDVFYESEVLIRGPVTGAQRFR